MRIFRHYIPRSMLVLGIVEALILYFSVHLGMELRVFAERGRWRNVAPVVWPAALPFVFVMIAVMTAMGLYERDLREGLWGILLRIVISALLGSVVMAVVFYAFPATLLGRGTFGFTFVIALAGVLAARAVFYGVVDREALKRRVLVLGTGARAAEIAHLDGQNGLHGCLVAGYVHMAGEHDVVEDARVIRRDTTLIELAEAHDIDEIVVAVEDRRKNFPLHEILDCRMAGIEVMNILTFLERQLGRVRLDLMHPSWLIFSDGFRYGVARVAGKRMFDIVASLLVLVLTWPLMLLASAAILVESGFRGPVFYRQVRVGQNWRLFQLTKFRSMRTDAEADGVARWAQEKDDRVTRVGAVLRKTRIDELPQVFNVLKGEMSVVGPRPERPVFVEQLSQRIPFYAERHRVKPGLTGWAQIRYPYGASEEDAAQKLQYDLYYVKNYSLFLDALILLQTAKVVLWGGGAR